MTTHLRTLAAEYLATIAAMKDTTLDAAERRELSSQRTNAHDALIAALGAEYARPFDMAGWCRELLRTPGHAAGA